MGKPRIWVHQPHKQPPGPQHVVEGEDAVYIHVAYHLDDEEEPPEDVHVDFRHEGMQPPSILYHYPWEEILDKDIDPTQGKIDLKDFPVELKPVPSSGTYDVRVRWTRKTRNKKHQVIGREFIGEPDESISQFFVD
jgi:hypothetical protein